MFSTVALKLPITASAKEASAGAPWPRSAGLSLGERRQQLRLQFLAQVTLEIGKAAETEPGDEAQDRGRRDAGAGGEFRNGVEAGKRIVAQEQMRGALLAWREGLHVVADPLGEARRISRGVFRALSLIPVLSTALLDGCEKLYQKFQKKKNDNLRNRTFNGAPPARRRMEDRMMRQVGSQTGMPVSGWRHARRACRKPARGARRSC